MSDNDYDAPPEEMVPEGADVVAALNAENETLKDRLLRAMADMENLRKRGEREKGDASQYAVTKFARDMLSVADNLTRALAALPQDSTDDALKAVFAGVEATGRELQATLERHGVKQVDAEGAKFDPHLHQAIAEVPGTGRPAGTVVNVVQTGYVIGDRLLRPAMVMVAKGDGPAANGSGGQVDTTA